MKQQGLNINDFYTTSDLALVTAISLWYPIDTIDRTNPRKAIFLFKRDSNFDQLVESYWRGELKVRPSVYFNQLKMVKTRLYGEG